ncbi:hypothetical protein C1N64_20710 [Pantoea sp. SGAir0215]
MQKPRKNNIKSPDNSNLPSLSPAPQKKGVLIYIIFFLLYISAGKVAKLIDKFFIILLHCLPQRRIDRRSRAEDAEPQNCFACLWCRCYVSVSLV